MKWIAAYRVPGTMQSPVRTSFVCGCLVVFAVCISLAAAAGAHAETLYPPPSFQPPAGHPRVYFTAKDVPRLRQAVISPQNALAHQAHLENLRNVTDGTLAPTTRQGAGNTDSVVLSVIASRAFEYALHGNKAYGKHAISALQNYLNSVVYPPDDYNNTGQTVYTIGIIYDWCYPLLSDADRRAFIQAALDTAAVMEIGWPPVRQGNVTGHGPEGQVFRDLLCASIAMADERPEMYRIVAGRFFSRMVQPKRFTYPAHMHPQGSHYSNYRGQWEVLATWVFDRMGLPQVFGADQRYFMYWSLYARRGDGQVFRDGDTHSNNRPLGEYYAYPYRTLMLAGNYFGDPYLKMEALRQRPGFAPMPPRGNQAIDCVEQLIFNDPDLEPRPLAELPLTHYFPAPKGAMIARTGWEDGVDSPSVVAEMKINTWYFANHQHLDAGAFQVYYRGVLANDSGYYQAGNKSRNGTANDGGTGYGSLHDINYHKRSIAHNVITVYNPDERFEATRWEGYPIANDGGQRMPNHWEEPREYEDLINPDNGYQIGAVLGHGFGPDAQSPDYTYLKGDLTHAYTDKVRSYQRSFVFLNLKQAEHPAALIVFDRVESSNPAFRKAWLLHGLEEPTITGNRTVFKDTRAGYTGKLTVDTLLPEPQDTQITPVGGPGRAFFVDGVNYPATLRDGGCNEGGGWRVEVSPKTSRKTDHFLHVLQVGDHTPDTPALPVQRIDTETHTGLRIADRVVLFAIAVGRTDVPVIFNVTGLDRAQVLVTDLQQGDWRIEHDGKAVGRVQVTEEAGLANFTGDAGDYRLVKTPSFGR